MPSLRDFKTTEAVDLPTHILDLLPQLPVNVDRRTGADLVTQHLFPVSHRSLEVWRLPWRHVNGKAVTPTAVLFACAYEKLAAAPVVMGGRQTRVAA